VSGPPFQEADCVDMDIVKVDRDGRRLRFGGGEGNRCELRPTVLEKLAYTQALDPDGTVGFHSSPPMRGA